tara:strand:+ start:183 stop:524 length:342 start_codon:yes stop_codon:yes gene_type:complete
MNRVKFCSWDCEVIPAKYRNGIIALKLETMDPHGYPVPVAVATVNLEDYEDEILSAIDATGNNYTFIKDYSENEGMLDALVKAGIVSEPLGFYHTGYVTCPLVEVLIDVEEHA